MARRWDAKMGSAFCAVPKEVKLRHGRKVAAALREAYLVPDRKLQSAAPGCNQRWLRCQTQIVLNVALGIHLRAICI
jgi:hypothetical protein